MDKDKFIKNFDSDQSFIVSGIYEEIELAREIDYIIFSKFFFPPNIWKRVEELKGYLGVEVSAKGLTEHSEKKMLGFYPGDFSEEPAFPILYFKIDCTNRFKELGHKDFLGSIMSLGIKRELLGDLIVENNICYGVTTEEIFEIIKKDLCYIGKIPVEISVVCESEIPKPKFQEIRETVTSSRLDVIISALLNISRNASDDLIGDGDVMIDYLVEKKGSRTIDEGRVITVRKKGKFILEKLIGENKKGKMILMFKKYI